MFSNGVLVCQIFSVEMTSLVLLLFYSTIGGVWFWQFAYNLSACFFPTHFLLFLPHSVSIVYMQIDDTAMRAPMCLWPYTFWYNIYGFFFSSLSSHFSFCRLFRFAIDSQHQSKQFKNIQIMNGFAVYLSLSISRNAINGTYASV